MKINHVLYLLATASLLAAACSAGVTAEDPALQAASTRAEPENQTSSTADPSPEDGSDIPQETENVGTGQSCQDPFQDSSPGFQTSYWEKTNFCKHSVDYDTIISGGPPPDGIPPIDSPRFESIASADEWLEDVEPVIALEIEGAARAYPLQIMTWHEIVNDTVGGMPVAVTFCPLCNSALVFERPRVGGERLTFGTSGNLRNSDLVMYDRQTESWWQQFSGEAIVGDLTGNQLQFVPSSISSWADFKSAYPEGRVLSIDTGYDRNYGANPYVGYDDVNASPFLYQGPVDDRLRPMERIVGVSGLNGESRGYPLADLQESSIIEDRLGDVPLVIFWKTGTASALDARDITAGKDIGTTGVYQRTVEGEVLTFTAAGDGTFRDEQTGSTWDIFGKALEGPLAGESLESIAHVDTFWFVWSAFQGPESLAR